MVVERNRAVFTEAPTAVQMEMWMFQGADDGKSGRMRGRRLTRRFWEMEICWRQWPGMGGIHSSGLRPMTSGKWKVRRTGNSFMITVLPNCDPAVSGGSPRPVGRMVFDILLWRCQVVIRSRSLPRENYNNIDKFRRGEMFSEKLGGCRMRTFLW